MNCMPRRNNLIVLSPIINSLTKFLWEQISSSIKCDKKLILCVWEIVSLKYVNNFLITAFQHVFIYWLGMYDILTTREYYLLLDHKIDARSLFLNGHLILTLIWPIFRLHVYDGCIQQKCAFIKYQMMTVETDIPLLVMHIITHNKRKIVCQQQKH